MKKEVKKAQFKVQPKIQGKTLGILSIIFAILSIVPFLGSVFALASITFGIIYVVKTKRRVLGTIGVILGVIGLLYSVYTLIAFIENPVVKLPIVDPETLKQQQANLERYFPENFTGIKRESLETYYSGKISLPFNGTKKNFDILLSDRAGYNDSDNNQVLKIWGEYVSQEQLKDYIVVMLNEIKSFSYPQGSGNLPLSLPKTVQYKNHVYIYSYRNSTIYKNLCDTCWFGSGKVFFPEENIVITVTFYKPIGKTYPESVANIQKILQEIIELNANKPIVL